MLILGAGIVGLLIDWKKVRFDKFEFLFLLFLLFACLSTVFSGGMTRSFLEVLKYTAYFILFVSLRRLSEKESYLIKKFYIVSILLNSVLLSIVSWSFLFRKPFLPEPSSGMNLYYGVFGHNRLADLLLIAIPINLFLYLGCQNKKSLIKKIYLGMLIFLFLSFIFTFSKSGYILMIILMFVVTYFFRSSLVIKRLLIGLTLPVFFVYLLVVINTYFLGFCGRSHFSWLCKPLYLDWRWDYYSISIKHLLQHPLFGVGLDNFRYLSKQFQATAASWSIYGENYFITLLSEVGVLGWLSKVLLIILFIQQTGKRVLAGENFLNKGIFFALFTSILHGFFTVDWYFLSIFLYFWVGMALLLPVKNGYFNQNNKLQNFQFRIISFFMVVIPFCFVLGNLLFNQAKKDNNNKLIYLSSMLNLLNNEKIQQLGHYHQDSHNLGSALFYYSLAQKLEPREYINYLRQADILALEGRKKEALENYQKALSLNPLDLSVYYQPRIEQLKKEVRK